MAAEHWLVLAAAPACRLVQQGGVLACRLVLAECPGHWLVLAGSPVHWWVPAGCPGCDGHETHLQSSAAWGWGGQWRPLRRQSEPWWPSWEPGLKLGQQHRHLVTPTQWVASVPPSTPHSNIYFQRLFCFEKLICQPGWSSSKFESGEATLSARRMKRYCLLPFHFPFQIATREKSKFNPTFKVRLKLHFCTQLPVLEICVLFLLTILFYKACKYQHLAFSLLKKK